MRLSRCLVKGGRVLNSILTPRCSTRRVVVAEGGEDVTIKVSDEGGGIPRSGMPNIWTYLYSTANHPVELDISVGRGGGGG